MSLIVQKFGGTSVADPSRIKKVVEFVQAEMQRGNQVVVVVSAMAGVTNHLITLCSELSSLNTDAQIMEYDVALCSGETVTASLLALSLQERSINARSILAWQLPIITDPSHSKALVQDFDATLIKDCLKNNIVPVIAGFQGVTKTNRLTTLGRGGSDTTAALVAAAVNADRCDIYTDVDGVFFTDPRIIRHANKIECLSFEEMFELALAGAKVLHPRCVEIAMRYNIPIRVLSSFEQGSGTLITKGENIMEHKLITGIAIDKNLLKVHVISNQLNANEFYILLAKNNIHITTLLLSTPPYDLQFNFLISLNDQSKLEKLLADLLKDKQITSFAVDDKISMVSIIGYGIKNDSSLIAQILSDAQLNEIIILMLQSSDIKLQILVHDNHAEKLVHILHEIYD